MANNILPFRGRSVRMIAIVSKYIPNLSGFS